MMGFDDATAAQVRAADPGASTWVSANAGSGKTRVLTDRVARLLLGGTEPGKILCLTYTKAAAAEMQNRLFRRLGEWAMMPDATLRQTLAELGEDPAMDADRLRAARRLFANALETPGGLKIQTIHAFCDKILRRFPLEAGVSPQFEALDEVAATRLRADVLDEMAEGPDAALVQGLATELTGAEVDALLQEIVTKRDRMDVAAITQRLGPEGEPEWQELQREIVAEDGRDTLRAVSEVLAGTTKFGIELGVLATEQDPQTFVREAERQLIYGTGAKDPLGPKRLGAKGPRDAHPALFDRLDALADRAAAARVRRAQARIATRSLRLARFGDRFVANYDRIKLLTGRLDFDDLIRRAAQLLESSESAQWVLYRLDGGIDHILVDEAQDTSPAQWRIIARLAEELAAGEGRSDRPRTLFVVGDEKQSIYSFQGADPAIFADMREGFRAQLRPTGGLADAALEYSFRSSDPILRLVDTVFEGPAGARFSQPSLHKPFKDRMPGRVDLWPFLEKEDTEEEPPWFEPVDTPDPADPRRLLADRVAGWIGRHLSRGTVLPGAGTDGADRAVQPGDFLILVRTRGPFFDHVIKALKTLEIPVAGADRMELAGQLAAKDLLSLLRWADLPDDDLSLAEVMRSPILGLSEAELFALAHRRKSGLWQHLRDCGRHGEQVTLLRDMLAQADYLRPHDLIDRVLTRHGARERLLARLGAECEDAIDELLSQALRYEQVETPTLSGFLHWFGSEDVTVKREMDSGANEIRVMTVHGAKGLEAPIVILPDTAVPQGNNDRASVLDLPEGGALWKQPKGDDKGLSQVQLEAEAARKQFLEEERLRLLYVAMTRAERWLVIAGAGKAGKNPMDSWYGLVEAGFDAIGEGDMLATQATEDPDIGPVRSLLWHWHDGAAPGSATVQPTVSLPAWATVPAVAAVSAPKPIRPSDLPGPKVLPGDRGLPEAEAKRRGTLIHLLLEHLGGVALHDRPRIATSLPGVTAADIAPLMAEVNRVLDTPDLAWIFAADVLAEVPVTGMLPSFGNLPLDGVIDRLVVESDRVVAIDFKSNAVVPDRVQDTPAGILAQLGAYAEVLTQIYPQKQIVTGILWTAEARFVTVQHKLVTGALARAARA